MAGVWGVPLAWAGGGFAAAILAVVLVLLFPALHRYRVGDAAPGEAKT
jgi:hypothetical protein